MSAFHKITLQQNAKLSELMGEYSKTLNSLIDGKGDIVSLLSQAEDLVNYYTKFLHKKAKKIGRSLSFFGAVNDRINAPKAFRSRDGYGTYTYHDDSSDMTRKLIGGHLSRVSTKSAHAIEDAEQAIIDFVNSCHNIASFEEEEIADFDVTLEEIELLQDSKIQQKLLRDYINHQIKVLGVEKGVLVLIKKHALSLKEFAEYLYGNSFGVEFQRFRSSLAYGVLGFITSFFILPAPANLMLLLQSNGVVLGVITAISYAISRKKSQKRVVHITSIENIANKQEQFINDSSSTRLTEQYISMLAELENNPDEIKSVIKTFQDLESS